MDPQVSPGYAYGHLVRLTSRCVSEIIRKVIMVFTGHSLEKLSQAFNRQHVYARTSIPGYLSGK